MRVSTFLLPGQPETQLVCPAQAGVHWRPSMARGTRVGLPRPGGYLPEQEGNTRTPQQVAPPRRGSTHASPSTRVA